MNFELFRSLTIFFLAGGCESLKYEKTSDGKILRTISALKSTKIAVSNNPFYCVNFGRIQSLVHFVLSSSGL